MKTPSCPQAGLLSRAFSDGGLPEHLAGCASCTAEWAALSELRRLGRALPFRVPESEERQQLRASLLAAAALKAQRHRQDRGGWALVAAAIVLLAIGLGVSLGRRLFATDRTVVVVRSTRHGVIHPRGAARFHELSGPPDEIVRLIEGTIVAEVSPLRPGERFRVTAGDAEIEVRGTAFEATAQKDHLARVQVFHGVVEVRPLGGAGVAQRLEGGAVWQAPLAGGALAEGLDDGHSPPSPLPLGEAAREAGGEGRRSRAAAVPPHPTPAASASPQPEAEAATAAERLSFIAPPGPQQPGAAQPRAAAASAAERAFDEGWAALRGGDYGAAAAAFGRAGGGGMIAKGEASRLSIGEDAEFWRAVALARAGRSAEAIAGIRGFVRGYPASARVGEAWSILGWLLYDQKDLAGAGRCFERAAQDPSAEVRQSARSGLSAIASQHGE